MKDYYQILGIQRNANHSQIKNAYRRMVKRFHPDLHPDKPEFEEKMKDINEAYHVLSNEEDKLIYDLSFQQSEFTYYKDSTNDYKNKSRTYDNYNKRKTSSSTSTVSSNPDNVVRAVLYPLIAIIYIVYKLSTNDQSFTNENSYPNKYDLYKFLPLKPYIIVDSTNAGKILLEDSDSSVNRIIKYVKDSTEFKRLDSTYNLIYNNRFK